MTADQVKGKSFRGALRYNLEKMEHKGAEVLDTTFAKVTEKSIMREVTMVRMQRPNLQKYFYHTSLNFPPHEKISNEQMVQIARDYLIRNGFDQHQYIVFRHHDADHPHMHLLVNRIGYDGSVVSDSNDYARSEKVLRQLEKEHRLTIVVSSKEAKERAMTKDELEMMKRTNEPSVKMQLQVILQGVLQHKPDTEQFIKALEAKGVNVLFNQASTGFVSGISYGYQGLLFKGASLGNAYKWTNVKNTIGYEQERDRAAIYEANIRTRSIQTSNRLAAVNGTGEGDRGISQQRARKLPQKLSNDITHTGDSIQKPTRRITKAAPTNSGFGKSDWHSESESLSKSTAPSLANILERGIGGLLFSSSHVTNNGPGVVPSLGDEFKKKKKKKRRGMRL